MDLLLLSRNKHLFVSIYLSPSAVYQVDPLVNRPNLLGCNQKKFHSLQNLGQAAISKFFFDNNQTTVLWKKKNHPLLDSAKRIFQWG